MKRLKVTVTVTKTVTYDYNPLYRSEDSAIDSAREDALLCIQDGDFDHSTIDDVRGEDLEPDYEDGAA